MPDIITRHISIRLFSLRYPHPGFRASPRAIMAGILSAAMIFGASAGECAAIANSNEEGRVGTNPHNFAKKELCALCHRDEPPRLHFDAVTTCVKCHEGDVGDHPVVRHPIGKAPRINMPVTLPLSSDGQIVCHTCHDPHNRSNYPRMLRVAPNQLCASCHVGY